MEPKELITQRMLVASDSSTLSTKVIPEAMQLAAELEAPVVLVSVIHPVCAGHSGAVGSSLPLRRPDELEPVRMALPEPVSAAEAAKAPGIESGLKAYPDRLTAREVEVLRLIAAGQTNKQIADQLVISVPTVERHISNIYAKIGTRGRANATAYAWSRGLVQPRES